MKRAPTALYWCGDVVIDRQFVFITIRADVYYYNSLMRPSFSFFRHLGVFFCSLGLILAKAVAMRVMINATGCPAPVSDRNRTHTHKHLSQLIELAIDHDIPTPV